LRYFVMNTKWYLSLNTVCADFRYSLMSVPQPPKGFA